LLLLIDEKGRKYLTEEEVLHTRYGVVDLRGTKAGGTLESHLGHRFSVLEPGIVDLYEKMPRAGSYLLKKDLGLILAHTGVGTGQVVVDAGTGSGAMAMFLGNIVRPTGRVHTYEIREEFAKIARGNIERAGLSEYVEVTNRDIAQGIDVQADLVTLDLDEPWRIVPVAYRALKPGGFIAVYTPYMEQARRTRESLKEAGFGAMETVELIQREMEFKVQGTRPRTTKVGHTGYLTFARKI
jgi:tRNA (adenine57-N1/adenine58-N1)-methyltransferase